MNLVDDSDNDGPTSTVILTGATGDYGNAVSVWAGRRSPWHSVAGRIQPITPARLHTTQIIEPITSPDRP